MAREKKRFKITAPNTKYNGDVGSARFKDGVAEIETEEHLLAYFCRQGYTVEPLNGIKSDLL